MLELTIRLIFSLAVVLGLLLLLTKLGARRFAGSKDALVRVVHRQQVSRGAAVSVVTVGSRVLVLGTTEQQVSVLAELDPEEIADELGGDLSGDLGEAEVLTLVADDETQTFALPAVAPSTPVIARPAGAHRAATATATPRGGRRAATRTTTRATTRATTRSASDGPLVGSVLSADTWRQALAAATRRAS